MPMVRTGMVHHLHTMRRIERTGPRSWTLRDEHGILLGSKDQPAWWSWRAELVVPGGLYIVRRHSPWSSDQAVFFGDAPVMVARYRMNRTEIVQPGTKAPLLTVRKKHWFSNDHLLTDPEGTVRATIRTAFNWNRFRSDHHLVEEHGAPLEPLMLLFALHTIQVQHQRAAAGAAT